MNLRLHDGCGLVVWAIPCNELTPPLKASNLRPTFTSCSRRCPSMHVLLVITGMPTQSHNSLSACPRTHPALEQGRSPCVVSHFRIKPSSVSDGRKSDALQFLGLGFM